MRKSVASFVAISSLLLAVAGNPAAADSQADALRRGAARRANGTPSLQLEGIQTVDSIESLDLNKGFSSEELVLIEKAFQKLLPSRVSKKIAGSDLLWDRWLSARRGSDLRNVFFYFGASAGNFIGIGGNLGVAFAHTKDGVIAAYPVVFARVNFVQLGQEAHIGLGELHAPIVNMTAGFQFGGAFLVGGALGSGDAFFTPDNQTGEEFWMELQAGLNFQAGGYLEFIL
jgi:hypothetical protein